MYSRLVVLRNALTDDVFWFMRQTDRLHWTLIINSAVGCR